MPRVNLTFTVGATPINIWTGTSVPDANPSDQTGKMAARLFIQMKTGGSARGYVMAGVTGRDSGGNLRVPSINTDLTAELQAATADGPGGNYSDFDTFPGPQGIPINVCWIHGANPGDLITVSYDLKV